MGGPVERSKSNFYLRQTPKGEISKIGSRSGRFFSTGIGAWFLKKLGGGTVFANQKALEILIAQTKITPPDELGKLAPLWKRVIKRTPSSELYKNIPSEIFSAVFSSNPTLVTTAVKKEQDLWGLNSKQMEEKLTSLRESPSEIRAAVLEKMLTESSLTKPNQEKFRDSVIQKSFSSALSANPSDPSAAARETGALLKKASKETILSLMRNVKNGSKEVQQQTLEELLNKSSLLSHDKTTLMKLCEEMQKLSSDLKKENAPPEIQEQRFQSLFDTHDLILHHNLVLDGSERVIFGTAIDLLRKNHDITYPSWQPLVKVMLERTDKLTPLQKETLLKAATLATAYSRAQGTLVSENSLQDALFSLNHTDNPMEAFSVLCKTTESAKEELRKVAESTDSPMKTLKNLFETVKDPKIQDLACLIVWKRANSQEKQDLLEFVTKNGMKDVLSLVPPEPELIASSLGKGLLPKEADFETVSELMRSLKYHSAEVQQHALEEMLTKNPMKASQKTRLEKLSNETQQLAAELQKNNLSRRSQEVEFQKLFAEHDLIHRYDLPLDPGEGVFVQKVIDLASERMKLSKETQDRLLEIMKKRAVSLSSPEKEELEQIASFLVKNKERISQGFRPLEDRHGRVAINLLIPEDQMAGYFLDDARFVLTHSKVNQMRVFSLMQELFPAEKQSLRDLMKHLSTHTPAETLKKAIDERTKTLRGEKALGQDPYTIIVYNTIWNKVGSATDPAVDALVQQYHLQV